MKKVSLFLLVFSALLAGCGNLPITPKVSDYVFYEDFESGNLSNFSLDAPQVDSILIETNTVSSGTYAVKFTIYPGDYIRNGSRSEMTILGLPFFTDCDTWYGYDLFIPTNWTDSGAFQLFGQWHTQPDYFAGESWENYPGFSPPVALELTNGSVFVDFALVPRYKRQDPTNEIEFGVWNTFRFHVHWSFDNSGYAEGWINGVKWFDPIYGRNQLNEAGNYFKFGIYRGADATVTNFCYYDNVWISNVPHEL